MNTAVGFKQTVYATAARCSRLNTTEWLVDRKNEAALPTSRTSSLVTLRHSHYMLSRPI